MAHDSREASASTPLGRSALWRFTLRQFLIGIAWIALACVGLRSASSWWVSAMLGLAYFTLTSALLLAVYRRAAQRAFWVGFATFGWVYLLLLIYGWGVEKPNSPVGTSSLLTHRISRASYDWLFAKADSGGYGDYAGGGYPGGLAAGVDSGQMIGSGYGGMMPGSGAVGSPQGYATMTPGPAPTFIPPSKTDFANVAHGIWAILLAACGGWLARLIYVTQPRDSSVPST
jgi:hypothetical protein